MTNPSIRERINSYFTEGNYAIWLLAGALGCCLLLVGSFMLLIIIKGITSFIPQNLYYLETTTKGSLIGEITSREQITYATLTSSGIAPEERKDFYSRILVKIGNREFGSDFIWLLEDDILSQDQPDNLMLIERREYGNFYGIPLRIESNDNRISYGDGNWKDELKTRLRRALQLFADGHKLEKNAIGHINYQTNRLRLQERKLQLDKQATPSALAKIEEQRKQLVQEYNHLTSELQKINTALNRDSLIMRTASNQEVVIPFAKIVRLYQTNQLNFWQRSGIYLGRLWEFISAEPRESNTEGGVLPAMFGTVMMVLLMTLFVLPLGVVAAIYLALYARQNIWTRCIRIAVNNLAGVPSIVYGMFGLGFFVYTVGGSIDRLFYPEALPSPTFGSGGILWASLTLALLTLPVVIIATEEGLTRIPANLSEGSMALGATKFETLIKISIPIATPAIMTGIILAIARATGEVAPLMIVGVVKLAPSLPIDMNAPFIHLERKFMHLGFHIYDMGFQSPNVEATRPLAYSTAALLLLIIVVLNATAVYLRNRLREKYRNLS